MVTYCLNTSTIRPCPLIDKIRVAAEAGYQGIELWINDIYEYIGRGGEARDVQQALADYGLIVPCMIALRNWGEPIGPEYELALAECRRRMELAARFRSPYVVATPPREPCPADQLRDRYRDLLAIGREVGVKPTFEYICFFASARSLADAWQVVRTIDDEDATLLLDSFHNFNTQSTLGQLTEIPLERISHYHVSDGGRNKPAGQQADPDRVMPGEGAADLVAEVRHLKSRGYRGTVSLELFNRELWERPPLEVAKLGLERLRALFEG